MARTRYGGSETSWLMNPTTGQPIPNTAFEIWDAEVGGTKQTDLQNTSGGAIAAVTSDSLGFYEFFGPNNFQQGLWALVPYGGRKLINPADLADRLVALNTSLTTTVFGAAQIPNLDAGKITSGLLAIAQLPGHDAAKIISGLLAVARIPDLDAAKIITGILAVARIPDLDAAKIITGTFPIARIPTGTSATVAALGNHTHASTSVIRSVKGADQPWTSNITQADVVDLVGTMNANTSYALDIMLIMSGDVAGDLKVTFTAPAGCTYSIGTQGPSSGATAGSNPSITGMYADESTAFLNAFGGVGAGVKSLAFLSGTVNCGATAGNFQVRAGQGASSAVSSYVHAKSEIVMSAW